MTEEFTAEPYIPRRVSTEHLELLAQYMERYPSLALASARSRAGVIQARRMWEKIARTLNRIDEGVTRNGKSWARYWIDLKFKIRKKYAFMKKCDAEGTPHSMHLTPFEERILKVLTDDEGNLLQASTGYYGMRAYLANANAPYLVKEQTINGSIKESKIEDNCGNDFTDDNQSQEEYLVPNTEHITIPDSDIKPTLSSINNCIDPIHIDEKKTIEDLKRELVEFELKKQKELFEMEKQMKIEKHELEMSILRLKKQMMVKELKDL